MTAIAAQPFLLQARVAGTARRHVPDFLLVHADGTGRVINVKPAARLAGRVNLMPPDAVTAAVLGDIRPGECLGELRLLWRRVSTDLSRPLDADSVMEVTR